MHYLGNLEVHDDISKTFLISESFWKPCLHQMQDHIFGGKLDMLTLLVN